MGTNRTASIAGGSAGIIGWVVFLIAFVLAPTPPTLEASAAEIVKYSTEHHSATLIAAFLFATTAPLFTVWSGALAARLRDAEGEGAWLYLVFLGGSIIALAVLTSVSFIWMALSGRGWTAGEGIAQTLSDIANYGYIFTGFGSVVFVGAAALVMMHTGEVARVMGQLGLLVAAVQVVYLFTCIPHRRNSSSTTTPSPSRDSSFCWAVAAGRVGYDDRWSADEPKTVP